MKVTTILALAVVILKAAPELHAQSTAVVINLTEQTAYLLENGRVALVSPIASGKEGWGTPLGRFHIIKKDLNHVSADFGLVVDSYGRIVNPNASPSLPPASRVPLYAGSDARLHAVRTISRDARGIPTWLPSISRLCADAPRSGGGIFCSC